LAGVPELRSVRADLEAAAASLRGEGQRQPTAQNTLSRIGALYKHQEAWESATIAVPSDADSRLVGLLRGPDPEFRDPIRFCLRDEFADPEGRRALADLFRRTLEEIALIDLRPDLFGSALQVDAERALEAPVELVDRAWRTGPFLDAACAERPGAERLGLVREAYRRWDRAVESLLVSRFPNYSGGST
jgi:hypothetical protein